MASHITTTIRTTEMTIHSWINAVNIICGHLGINVTHNLTQASETDDEVISAKVTFQGSFHSVVASTIRITKEMFDHKIFTEAIINDRTSAKAYLVQLLNVVVHFAEIIPETGSIRVKRKPESVEFLL